jgi:hypothetical protein
MATYANVGHVLLKRGNTIQQNTYTGPLGELTFDTDLHTVRVHDNATPGGITTLATQAQINSVNNSIALTNSNLANVIVSTNSNLATAVSTINNNISAITGFDSNVVANLSALLSDASIQQTTINNIEANVLSLQNNPVYANANVASFLPVYGGNIALTNINNEGYNWTFSNVGELTLPNGGHLGPVGKGWTGLDGGAGNPVSLLSYYNSGMYSGCFTITPGSSAQITTYGNGTGQTGQWTFANNGVLTTTGDVVVGGNVSLNGGVIHGGTPTVTDINDTITIISLGTTTVLIFENNVFEYPTRGLANVTGISTTTQANGSWYYEAINSNAVALYTDNTYATEVNSSAWTPYTSGDGLIAIAQDVPGESVVVDANGYLTTFNYVGALQLPTSADLEGQQKYSVVQTPFNADLQLQVGNDSVYTFTANGNVTLPGGIKFSDNTVQTTAAVNPDSNWTNPNNNTWHIRTYNGGYSFTYAQGASPTVWWDAANSPLGGLNQFRGAVIEYHAYISGNTNGTVVGSIIVAQDGTTNIEATHTENIDLFNNASTINFWSRPSYTQLGYSNSGLTVSGQQDNVMIMWTARVFYGSENAC